MIDLKGNRDDRLVCLLGLILAFGTLACYWPVHHFEFINLDDSTYVYDSSMVRQGLSWQGFVWAFQSIEGGNWNPLVWLSHMADCQLFGLKPGGHHVTNLLLHTANAVLLFLALKSMTNTIWRSAFVAAIFAWHPMHVESVAWVSERKDVLSTLFLFAAIWAYTSFSKAEGSRRKMFYTLSLVLFILGLMCKSMLVTLPFMLLLLDYWPLQRTESAGQLVLEKLPYLALSAAASVLAVWTQNKVGAIGNAPLLVRVENAAVSYITYLGKLFWPVNSAIFYPYPDSITIWKAGGAALLLGIITWAVIVEMKKHRYLGVGWFWFLGTLLPVIGLVSVGMQAWADRYTYIPYIGLSVIIGWGTADMVAMWPRCRGVLLWFTALALACSLAATSTQVKYWQNNFTLYEHALKVTSGNYIAHSDLGYALMDNKQYDEAVKHLEEVIRIKPGVAPAYNSLGNAYAMQGKLDTAMAMYSNAISFDPKLEQAHYNLGHAYFRKGKMAEAIPELKKALSLKSDDIPAQRNLAEALIKLGKTSESISYCESAVKAAPEDAHARFNLGLAYQKGKQPEQALACYKEALQLAPNSPQCLNALAWIYATCPKAEVRNSAEAVRLATKACEITKRKNPQLLDTLAAACAEAGRFDEAIKTTEEINALALSTHDTNATDMAQQRLKLYKAGKPYRDEE